MFFYLIFFDRPLWLNGLKILVFLTLIAVCVTILLFVRKTSTALCSNCKSKVSNSALQCQKCGQEMNSQTREIIIQSNRKKGAVCALITSIVLLAACIISFVFIYSEGYISQLSTGFYSGKNEIYTQNDKIWGMEIDSAVSSGTFNKTIKIEKQRPSKLLINSKSSKGTLILNIVQEDKIQSIDISNTNGLMEYDLDGYEDSDIKLSVEHTKGKNIKFKIEW